MSYIRTYNMQHSTILRIYSMKEEITINPEYQRMGDIWTLEKKQLLIDSILNDYDIPKLYFHRLDQKDKNRAQRTSQREYSIIDGRQRIETIWRFLEGSFSLDTDFKYLDDDTVNMSGYTYSEIGKKYPKIKIKFDSYVLPIIEVETDDLELIEDMFSRLNEAVPLNAAEKRNAFGGDMAKAIRDLSKDKFFKNKVRFTNHRYQHQEASAKILFLSHSIKKQHKIIDTKKYYLDQFVKDHRNGKSKYINTILIEARNILSKMNEFYIDNDILLRAQGAVPVYYLLFKELLQKDMIDKISRQQLIQFKEQLEDNRRIAEKDMANAIYEYLEYDRLSQQGTNDASSISTRLETLKQYLKVGE